MLPNLVIIGAMKCGTSSLHNHLNLHPQIRMSQPKELDFFVEEKNWRRGLKWYQSKFTESAEVLGESSPNYSKYPLFKGVTERMHRIIPDAKLIFLVRDPIKRIVSHYIHNVAAREEHQSFSQALTDLHNNKYVNCSQYHMQLEHYLGYYPPSNILVLSLEDLAQDQVKTLHRVFCFLKVDPSLEHEDFTRVFNRSSQKKRKTILGSVPKVRGLLRPIAPWLVERSIEKPQLSEPLRQALVGVLHNDVEKLRALTGYSFANWSL